MEIKKYLPIKEKMSLIELVVQNSFGDEGYNNVMKEIMFDYAVTTFYTDLYNNADENLNVLDIYDEIHENGNIAEIMESVPYEEIGFLKNNIQEKINFKIKQENNLNFIIKDFLDKCEKKIPSTKEIQKIIKTLSKEFKNISPENMSMLQNILKEQVNLGVKK